MKTTTDHHAYKKAWYAQQEQGAFWGMRITFAVLNFVGRKGVAPLVYLVVTYFFLFGRKARNASLDYLAHIEAFAPHTGIQSNLTTAFWHFIEFASAILDKLQAWQGKIGFNEVDFHNHHLFSNLNQKNIGGIFIGSHLGNMEVCRALGSLSGKRRLTVLVHTKHAQNFNRLLEQAGANTVELLQVTEIGVETALRLQEKINQGEWIVIVGDRIPVGGGRIVQARFMGETASFPQGPFILASLLHCPVLLLFCIKRNKRYQIILEEFAEQIQLRRKFRETDLSAYVEKYAQQLEQHCLSAPLQWYNFFPFWQQHVEKDFAS